MKKWLILFSLLSLKCLATDTVTIYTTSGLTVTATSTIASASTSSQANCQTNAGSGSFNLHTEDPSSDGHTETGLAKVYVPILNTDATNYNCAYLESFNSQISGANYKPLSRGTSATTPTSTDVINFPLYLTVSTTAKYLYAAVKDGSDYKIVKKSAVTYQNITNSSVTFGVSPAEICNAASTYTACSKTTGELLEASTSLVSSPISLTVFFFLDDTSYGPEDTAPSVGNFTGTYFQVNMSNRVFPSSIPSISAIRKGDKRVNLTYSTSTNMSSSFFRKIGIYNFASANSSNSPLGSFTTGSKLTGDFSTAQSGDAIIYGLTNGSTYNLGVYLLDNFNFASPVSVSVVGTPIQIEELLKKQSCFLLTAGFGEEHFVIDYFRNFRDQTLSKYFLGQIFIKNYYKYAPSFALSIYNNQPIRFIIRTSAYFLYYLFHYFGYILGILVLNLFIFRKIKSKILKV